MKDYYNKHYKHITMKDLQKQILEMTKDEPIPEIFKVDIK